MNNNGLSSIVDVLDFIGIVLNSCLIYLITSDKKGNPTLYTLLSYIPFGLLYTIMPSIVYVMDAIYFINKFYIFGANKIKTYYYSSQKIKYIVIEIKINEGYIIGFSNAYKINFKISDVSIENQTNYSKLKNYTTIDKKLKSDFRTAINLVVLEKTISKTDIKYIDKIDNNRIYIIYFDIFGNCYKRELTW